MTWPTLTHCDTHFGPTQSHTHFTLKKLTHFKVTSTMGSLCLKMTMQVVSYTILMALFMGLQTVVQQDKNETSQRDGQQHGTLIWYPILAVVSKRLQHWMHDISCIFAIAWHNNTNCTELQLIPSTRVLLACIASSVQLIPSDSNLRLINQI